MSSPIRHGLLAVLCVAGLARGQSVREYQTRLDTLTRIFEADERHLAAFDDSVRRFALQDTVRVGAVVLLADPSLTSLAREAAENAWTQLRAVYGHAADSAAAAVYAVRRSTDTTGGKQRVVVGRMYASGPPLEETLFPEPTAVARSLREAMLATLGDRMGSPFRAWYAFAPWPDTMPDAIWAFQRLDLISSRTTIARRCYAGDIANCELALELRAPADPIMDWYDADGRNELVRRSGQAAYRVARSATTECVSGSDSACIVVLHRLPGDYVQKIMPGSHASLVSLALFVGGAGAPERLLSTAGGPRERLAAASGVPIDSLVKIWRQRVRDARTPSDDMSPGIALASLSWILVLGALSVRSSRWR